MKIKDLILKTCTILISQAPLDLQGHPVGPGVVEVEEMADRPILLDYHRYVDPKMMKWHPNLH